MKRIYIAGCGGMLGEAFHKQFANDYELSCSDIDVNAEWLSYLDFRDYDSYLHEVSKFSPDYLFHLGAHTDLEYCELNQEDAYLTNTVSVENAVSIANQLRIPLLYISTAGIFDGRKEKYDDWDAPNPIGTYARSKYMGERYVIKNSSEYLICRAGWMMGGGPNKDKKFVNKIIQQIKYGSKVLHVVNDKLGTPTYTHDFARNVKLLLEKSLWGLYNVVCEGETSRLEIANEILNILGSNGTVKISEVGSSYFRKEYFAPRPASERLINSKLNIRKMNLMRDWRISLREYLETYYQDYLA